jgi:hypothetical protein
MDVEDTMDPEERARIIQVSNVLNSHEACLAALCYKVLFEDATALVPMASGKSGDNASSALTRFCVFAGQLEAAVNLPFHVVEAAERAYHTKLEHKDAAMKARLADRVKAAATVALTRLLKHLPKCGPHPDSAASKAAVSPLRIKQRYDPASGFPEIPAESKLTDFLAARLTRL